MSFGDSGSKYPWYSLDQRSIIVFASPTPDTVRRYQAKIIIKITCIAA